MEDKTRFLKKKVFGQKAMGRGHLNSSVSQSIDEDTNVVSQKKYAVQIYF